MIGAGSITFSLELLMDLWLEPGLRGSSVRLMDIDEKRLQTLQRLVRRYRKEYEIDLDISYTRDRREALQDADYVICAVKVGGYGPLEKERKIAEEFGYYRGIGDRVSCYYGGVGAFHQLDFFLSLARDMEEVCPGALLIQTANPVFEGTTLVSRKTAVRTVGVCHGHYGYRELCRVLGVPPEEVTYTIAGVNHCVWLTHFSHKGSDLYPRLDDWIANEAERFWRSEEFQKPGVAHQYEQVSPAAVEMYRYYGVFPIGERAVLREELPVKKSGEQHIAIIDALENDKECLLELNVENDGLIDGIGDDVIVEIPALVSSKGIQGLRIGRLPGKLMHHVVNPRINRMEQVLHAYLQRDRNSLLLSLMEDNRSSNLDNASALLEQPWNESARQHYR